MNRGAWQATAHRVPKKVRHDLVTKQKQEAGIIQVTE